MKLFFKKNINNFKKDQQGFNLLEFILVISIFLILAASSASLIIDKPAKEDLDAKTREVVDLVAKARNYAMTGYLNDNWGVKVLNDDAVCMENGENLDVAGTDVLADMFFNDSNNSGDLIDNGSGQDWYESRGDGDGVYALKLSSNSIGGNGTKKAYIVGDANYNTYVSQEFSSIPSDSMVIQWDVYIENVLDIAGNPDRTGWSMIGNDQDTSNGPNSTNDDRWLILAWAKEGGGDTGTVSLTYRDADDDWASFSVASSTLQLDTWYTVKVVANFNSNTYDIYVDDMLQVSGATARAPATAEPVTHISFASWNDGAGSFAIDNVGVGSNDCIKLFKGSNYNSRSEGYDETVRLDNSTYLEPSEVNEFYFHKMSGWLTTTTPKQSIILKSNNGEQKTVTTTRAGLIYYDD